MQNEPNNRSILHQDWKVTHSLLADTEVYQTWLEQSQNGWLKEVEQLHKENHHKLAHHYWHCQLQHLHLYMVRYLSDNKHTWQGKPSGLMHSYMFHSLVLAWERAVRSCWGKWGTCSRTWGRPQRVGRSPARICGKGTASQVGDVEALTSCTESVSTRNVFTMKCSTLLDADSCYDNHNWREFRQEWKCRDPFTISKT